jgi:hypothetical protein
VPEFPLLVSSGVPYFEGVGLFVADDGMVYYQDGDGNRIPLGAALAGALVAADNFLALGHNSPDGGYGELTPAIHHGVFAHIHSTGPANTELMQAGNWAVYLDLENSEMVFKALDDDGNVLTGTVAIS